MSRLIQVFSKISNCSPSSQERIKRISKQKWNCKINSRWKTKHNNLQRLLSTNSMDTGDIVQNKSKMGFGI